MKHRVVQRAGTVVLEHDGRGVATVGTNASHPRQGRSVSEAIVSRFVAGFDTVAIFAASAMAMQALRQMRGLVIAEHARAAVGRVHAAQKALGGGSGAEDGHHPAQPAGPAPACRPAG